MSIHVSQVFQESQWDLGVSRQCVRELEVRLTMQVAYTKAVHSSDCLSLLNTK